MLWRFDDLASYKTDRLSSVNMASNDDSTKCQHGDGTSSKGSGNSCHIAACLAAAADVRRLSMSIRWLLYSVINIRMYTSSVRIAYRWLNIWHTECRRRELCGVQTLYACATARRCITRMLMSSIDVAIHIFFSDLGHYVASLRKKRCSLYVQSNVTRTTFPLPSECYILEAMERL